MNSWRIGLDTQVERRSGWLTTRVRLMRSGGPEKSLLTIGNGCGQDAVFHDAADAGALQLPSVQGRLRTNANQSIHRCPVAPIA